MPDNNDYRARRPQHDPELIKKLAEDVLGVPKAKPAAEVVKSVGDIPPVLMPEKGVPAKSLRNRDGSEFVQFATRIPKALQRKIRLFSVEHDISIQALTLQALNCFVDKETR